MTSLGGLEQGLRQLMHGLGYAPEDDFLKIAHVTRGTAEAWRKRGDGPKWLRLGNAIYYPLSGIAEAMNSKVREPRKVAAKELL